MNLKKIKNAFLINLMKFKIQNVFAIIFFCILWFLIKIKIIKIQLKIIKEKQNFMQYTLR